VEDLGLASHFPPDRDLVNLNSYLQAAAQSWHAVRQRIGQVYNESLTTIYASTTYFLIDSILDQIGELFNDVSAPSCFTTACFVTNEAV